MTHDERDERARRREPLRGAGDTGGAREPPRPQRLGDRGWREGDDPEYGMERYGGGLAAGYGGGEFFGPTSDPDSFFGAPGFDAGFAGPRFDRLDVGSVGSHGVHPVSSPFGADYRGATGIVPGGYGSSARRYALLNRHGRHDPHYAEWRDRQIDQLDRDYDEYRREQQARFDREFGEWRERRGRQRQAVARAAEQMEVVGSDGAHVGIVDCTRGDDIILSRSDSNSAGHHHAIPCGWVDSVDDKVRLNLTAAEAIERWRHEGRGALFERGGRDEGGPRRPDRSFAGPYRDED